MQKLMTASLATAALVAALSSVAFAAPATLAVTTTSAPAPAPDQSGGDRTFHPDYSKALTPDQMTVAWKAEIDRVFQTPIAGGG